MATSRAVLAALLVVAPAMGGCGGGDPDRPGVEELEAALVTEDELPAGFRETEPVEVEMSGFGDCLLGVDEDEIATHAEAQVEFTDVNVRVGEVLFIPEESAEDVVAEFAGSTDACDGATGAVNGIDFTFRTEPLDLDLDLPGADDIVVLALMIRVETFESGPAVEQHIVVVRRGELVHLVATTGPPELSPDLVSDLTAAAYEKAADLEA